ncbi:MAG: CehA/McbA family metallohydrolase [Anaerolineae bacterium]|jgi:hypothetical protein|nr:CehA/McbA family metallohydrolase [Chloroflexota bacterium]
MAEHPWVERVANLHIHSTASDGTAGVPQIVEAARDAELDVIVITDHNVRLPEFEGWRNGVLVLVGQELNPFGRPHQDHLLVLGAQHDLSDCTASLQEAIDAARASGGLPLIAHPIEHSGAAANEPDINWISREVTGLHGIEIWNLMSEFKSRVHTLAHGLLYAYLPGLAIRGPLPETLRLWDAQLAAGPSVAVGGSDAHATVYRLGPLRRRILPYRYLFGGINTHLLLRADWSREKAQDVSLVIDALAAGRCFVANDRVAPARGTRYRAESMDQAATFGGTLPLTSDGVRLVVNLPAPAEIRLLRDGAVVAQARGASLEHVTRQPGTFRFEAWRRLWARPRAWIFGNPIRVASPASDRVR